jgi:hypothetical protein
MEGGKFICNSLVHVSCDYAFQSLKTKCSLCTLYCAFQFFDPWVFESLVLDSWLFMFINNSQLSQILNFNNLIKARLKDWTNEKN